MSGAATGPVRVAGRPRERAEQVREIYWLGIVGGGATFEATVPIR
ncbi:hypothetical protein [Streptomyces rubellomurinus]|nr:hypothetical protein [Streptomyces rubellomurinus]